MGEIGYSHTEDSPNKSLVERLQTQPVLPQNARQTAPPLSKLVDT